MILLDTEGKQNLIQAMRVCLSHTKRYKEADVSGKINLILIHAVTTIRNMESELNSRTNINPDHSFTKKAFVEFYKNVKNKFTLNRTIFDVQEYHKDKETGDEINSMIHSIYRAISMESFIDTLVDVESDNNVFISEELLKNVYNVLNKEFKIKIPGKTFNEFSKHPSRYLMKATHINGISVHGKDPHIKIGIIKLMLGLAFLDGTKLETYISTVKSFISATNQEERSELIMRLNGFNIGRKMIYTHRMSELNAIMLEIILMKHDGFDVVFKSVLGAITYCKMNGVETFLQVTNTILNNLIVSAFNDIHIYNVKEKELNQSVGILETNNPHVSILMSAIKQYITIYYMNRSRRVCAYSIDTAMKQALAAICKFDKDIFTGGAHE